MEQVRVFLGSLKEPLLSNMNSSGEVWNKATSFQFLWESGKSLLFSASAVIIACYVLKDRKIILIPKVPKESLLVSAAYLAVIPKVVDIAEKLIFKESWVDRSWKAIEPFIQAVFGNNTPLENRMRTNLTNSGTQGGMGGMDGMGNPNPGPSYPIDPKQIFDQILCPTAAIELVKGGAKWLSQKAFVVLKPGLVSVNWGFRNSSLVGYPIVWARGGVDSLLGGHKIVHWMSVAFAVYLVAPRFSKN